MSDFKEFAEKTLGPAIGDQVADRLIEFFRHGDVVVPQYLSTKQAATWCGFSFKSFEHRRATGTGPRGIKVGNQWRYSIDDLRSWMESHAIEGGAK